MNSFDERAATWDDDPAKVERARVVASAITSSVPLDGTSRLLEFGAGTGLVSEALHADVGPVTMADTSAGMRAVMRAKIDAGAIPDARVWDLDLSTHVTPPDDRFDLVVTVLALHHVDAIDRTLAHLGELLVPGGHLCIVDLDFEDGSFHGDGFEGHPGFDRADLAARLTTAGFADPTFQACHHVERNGRDYPMFLAIATR